MYICQRLVQKGRVVIGGNDEMQKYEYIHPKYQHGVNNPIMIFYDVGSHLKFLFTPTTVSHVF